MNATYLLFNRHIVAVNKVFELIKFTIHFENAHVKQTVLKTCGILQRFAYMLNAMTLAALVLTASQ